MDANPSVGVAGLGRMGQPIAANLAAAGFPLTVWNRSQEKTTDLVAPGAGQVSTPRELGTTSSIVLTSLADPAAVEAVYLGPDGLIGSVRPGTVLVDLSTVAPELSRRLAEAAAERGASLLDAPVAGSIKAAVEGALAIMVGGDRDAYDACAAVFAAIGRTSYYMGESGSGSTMKLVTNTMLATMVQALSEGLALGAKAGLQPATMFEVIGASSAAAPVVAAKATTIIEGAYQPAAFTLKLMQKDLWLALSLANDLAVPMPATSLTHDIVLAANAAGKSGHDFAAVAQMMEELAGL